MSEFGKEVSDSEIENKIDGAYQEMSEENINEIRDIFKKEKFDDENTEKICNELIDSIPTENIEIINDKINLGIRFENDIDRNLKKEQIYGDYYVCKLDSKIQVINKTLIDRYGFIGGKRYIPYIENDIGKSVYNEYKKFLKKTISDLTKYFTSGPAHESEFIKYKKGEGDKFALNAGILFIKNNDDMMSDQDVDMYRGTFGKRGKSYINHKQILSCVDLTKNERYYCIENSENFKNISNKLRIMLTKKIIIQIEKLSEKIKNK